MKIVYFAHSVLSRGGDKMILAHLGHLAALGHEVTIRSTVVDTIYPIDSRITISHLPATTKAGTLLAALLGRQEGECIIATIVPTALLLALRNRGRVLFFAQDDNETVSPRFLWRALIRLLYFLAFRLLRIPTITVSSELADTFKRRYGFSGVVVPNGVDTMRFFRDPSPDLMAMKQGRKALLILSRTDQRKGFDVALDVASTVSAVDGDSLELWIVGEECSQNDNGMIVRHFGYVDEERLRHILSSADVFLYPSRSEGFPLMVIEAFACGCPVVTTTAVTLARDGVSAYVTNVDDVEALSCGVLHILQNHVGAEECTKNGLEFVREHSLERSSSLFAATLLCLMGEKRRRCMQ